MVRLNLDKAANFSLKNMGYESLPVSQKVKAVKPSGSSGWYVFLVYLENNELFRSETRCRVNWGLVRGSSVGEASGGGHSGSQCRPGSCFAHSCACWLPTDVPTLPWSRTGTRTHTHVHQHCSHLLTNFPCFRMSGGKRSSPSCAFAALLICA